MAILKANKRRGAESDDEGDEDAVDSDLDDGLYGRGGEGSADPFFQQQDGDPFSDPFFQGADGDDAQENKDAAAVANVKFPGAKVKNPKP